MVSAIEYGSWPLEQPADQMRTRAPLLAASSSGGSTLRLEVLEVMRLAKEAGHVGGQRRQHLLALVEPSELATSAQ